MQHDDAVIHHDETNTYLKKRKKLMLESEDYEQTLEFMDKLMVIARKEQVSEKDLSILSRTYNMIMRVYRALSHTLYSDRSSSVWDIDVSLTINESRSKVEKELNYICNNMTNHTIKEAVSHHLVGFKAGHLPKMLFPRVNFLTSNSIACCIIIVICFIYIMLVIVSAKDGVPIVYIYLTRPLCCRFLRIGKESQPNQVAFNPESKLYDFRFFVY